MQALKRADHLAQNVGGDLGIECGSFKLLVAKHDLNHTDIDLLLKEMGGETMPLIYPAI
jgi:hypothetical protein